MLHGPTVIRHLLVLLAACAAPAAESSAADGPPLPPCEQTILAAAEEIHQRCVTIDTHVDIPGAHYATDKLDPGIDNPRLKCDLVKMNRGGVDGVFLAVYVGQGRCDAEGYRRAYDSAMAKFEAIRRLTETMYPDRCRLATSPDEVLRIAAGGKRAVMIGVENGYPIGIDLANLQRFYDLGARYITLSHNGHNQICDSCNPSSRLGDAESKHNGLSPFGEQVVAKMNRLGMIVDVSHIAEKSFWDVLEISKAPVIASHSGCRAVNDHPRNLDDRQLEALAKGGGVIQIVALGSFLKSPSPQRRNALTDLAAEIGLPSGPRGSSFAQATAQQRRRYEEGIKEIDLRYPPAGINDFVDHIDHAVRIAGIDHVGIGTDFDGGGGIPGFNDHSEALNVTVELVRRGYSEEQIKKIWGGNLLRVWRRVEQVAATLQEQDRP